MGLPKDISYQALARQLVHQAGVDTMTRGLFEENLGTALAGGMSVEDAQAALQVAKEAQASGALTPTGSVLEAVGTFYHERDEAIAAQRASPEAQYYQEGTCPEPEQY